MTAISKFLSILTFCIISPIYADESKPTHLFILSGQSNMTPTLSHSFRDSVQKVFGKDRVSISVTGHPGQPIKSWVKDWPPPNGGEDPKSETNGKLYEKLIDRARRTLKNRKPTTVTFVWMQGEADAGSSWASVYEKSFFSLVNQIKTDLDVKKVNFVVGRINDYWLSKPDGKTMRELQIKLGEDHDNGAWINTDDLNRGVNPWGGFSFEDGHFPPAGYIVMGQRFAKQACRLADPNQKLDPKILEEHLIDSHKNISTHAAVDKSVVAINGSLNQSTLNHLLDNKFGGLDHNEKSWVGFAPSEKPIELIIDLGNAMSIDELGGNTLISSKAKAEFPNHFIYNTPLDGKDYQATIVVIIQLKCTTQKTRAIKLGRCQGE